MSDEVSVPVYVITDDWTIDDLRTTQDCDDAMAILTEAIASIEAQMALATDRGNMDAHWWSRAKKARRYKKATFAAVQTRRGEIRRAEQRKSQIGEDREIVNKFRELYPDEFMAVLRALGRLEGDGLGAAPNRDPKRDG